MRAILALRELYNRGFYIDTMDQVVGGVGFIISGLLFMLETQPNWYTPALTTLGWHIGLWNLIGAIGFTLCGALGFASSNEACETGLTWSTFIGSWAFLVSPSMNISIPSSLPPASGRGHDSFPRLRGLREQLDARQSCLPTRSVWSSKDPCSIGGMLWMT